MFNAISYKVSQKTDWYLETDNSSLTRLAMSVSKRPLNFQFITLYHLLQKLQRTASTIEFFHAKVKGKSSKKKNKIKLHPNPNVE